MTITRRLVALVVLAGLLVGAGTASADGVIESDPLTITTSDANELQVKFTAAGVGEFDPARLSAAQFGLIVDTPEALYGFAGEKYELVGDHFRDEVSGLERMTSVYHVTLPGGSAPALEVTEEILYEPGTYEMRVSYTFKSLLVDGELTFTPKILANAAPGGESVGRSFDFGEGLRITTSDRAAEIEAREVFGTSSPAWLHFEAGDYLTLEDEVRNRKDFADTDDPERQDAGFGVQWPEVTLGPGKSSAPHEIVYSFAHRLELTPREATLDQGQTKTLTGQYAGPDGLPEQTTLHYIVTGANPQGDTEFTTELDGSFRIDLQGVNYGLDQVVVYEDIDGNPGFDPERDRFRDAVVGWRAPPEPADNLALAMDEVEAVSVGGSYLTNPPGAVPLGPADKVINGSGADFPRAGSQFALLTTGNADAAFGEGSGDDAGGGLVRGAHDVTILKIDLSVAPAANCLSIDLRFLSNEDPDPGNPFNDSFIAELDSSTWQVQSGQVQAPNNFAADVNGRPLSVGGQGVVEMNAAGAAGTNYGAGTGILRARTPVTPGVHSLYLSIFDLDDEFVDSGALVDKLEAISVPPDECIAYLESPQGATRVTVDPSSSVHTIGEQQTASVAAFDADDNPTADELLRYFVSGANPVADAALPLGRNGTGQVTWFGGNAGDDALTVYRDVDGDEQMDPGERVGGSTVTWTAPLPRQETQQQQQQQQPRQAALTLSLAPVDEAALPGTTHAIRATALTDGVPLPNATLRYRTEGTHPGSGEATTNAGGQATISVRGTRPGEDRVTAFLDADRDGSQGVGEPVAIARVEWLEPPKLKKTANADPVAGTVLIKLPPGTSLAKARRLGLAGATSGFIALTEAKQIPLGSTLDTTRGRVQLQTIASNKNPGVTQAGDFYEGLFQVRQVGSSRAPITEATLNERLQCQPNRRGREVVQAGRRSRRLWGSGRGRFRTRGRNSTATVRGTVWLTKDTCDTTTTRVRSGTVVVRDIAKKKNVTVRQGRTYVARARRR